MKLRMRTKEQNYGQRVQSSIKSIRLKKKRGGGLGNVRENKSTQANLADAVGLTKVDFSLFTS